MTQLQEAKEQATKAKTESIGLQSQLDAQIAAARQAIEAQSQAQRAGLEESLTERAGSAVKEQVLRRLHWNLVRLSRGDIAMRIAMWRSNSTRDRSHQLAVELKRHQIRVQELEEALNRHQAESSASISSLETTRHAYERDSQDRIAKVTAEADRKHEELESKLASAMARASNLSQELDEASRNHRIELDQVSKEHRAVIQAMETEHSDRIKQIRVEVLL